MPADLKDGKYKIKVKGKKVFLISPAEDELTFKWYEDDHGNFCVLHFVISLLKLLFSVLQEGLFLF